MLFQLADLYPLIGAATWAVSSAIIKWAGRIGNATQLNLLRTGIGAVLFIFHLLLLGKLLDLFYLPSIIILILILSVLTNIVIGDTAYFASQNRIGVKVATPIVNTYPVATIILAVIFLDEAVSRLFILGTIVTLVGIIMLSLDKNTTAEENILVEHTSPQKEDEDHTRSNLVFGISLALLAVFSYALGIIFTTVGAADVDAVVANSIRLPVATVFLFLLTMVQSTAGTPDQKLMGDINVSRENTKEISFQEFLKNIAGADLITLALLLFAGILGTYISSYFLVLSVQAIGASRTSILFSVGPFFSLPIAVLWLKEHLGWLTLSGTICTVIGVWLVLI